MIAAPIIAHRGLSSLCPENTLIAMYSATKTGATWVESDVQVLEDGTAIMIHDYEISRTTDSDENIESLSRDKIEHIDAGSWFDTKFSGERIPLLTDMLDTLDELNMGLNLEVKYDLKIQGIPDEKKITFIIDAIFKCLKHSPPPPKGLLMSSFHFPFLEEIRRHDENMQLGYIVHGYEEKYIQEIQSVQGASIHINKESFLDVSDAEAKTRIANIKNAGLDIYVYTVNQKDDGKKLFDLGIDGIFTDYAQSFPRYLP